MSDPLTNSDLVLANAQFGPLDETVAKLAAERDRWKSAFQAALKEQFRLEAENERLRGHFQSIVEWSKAYPLKVFPEPDLKRAHELLKAGGMTLDAISASAMRHVITEVAKIAECALTSKEE
jgi:hypothetical protein